RRRRERRERRWGMRRRLLFSYLSLTLFVLLALELPLGVSFSNAEHRRLVSQIESEAFALALRADTAVTDDAHGELAPLAEDFHRRTGHSLVVVDSKGRVIVSIGRGEPREGTDAMKEPDLATAIHGRQQTRSRTAAGTDELAASVPVLAGSTAIGAVRVSASLADVSDRTQRNWLLLAALGGVTALVVFLVSLVLARS